MEIFNFLYLFSSANFISVDAKAEHLKESLVNYMHKKYLCGSQ